MRIVVNGDSREAAAASVAEYLGELGLHAKIVVVERNGDIVPRDRYDQTPLEENDVLEIVQMMAGG